MHVPHDIDDGQPRFVRVIGVRRDFVEFSFAIGDPDLSVALVLPASAFLDLCKHYDVTTIEPEPAVATAYAELVRRVIR